MKRTFIVLLMSIMLVAGPIIAPIGSSILPDEIEKDQPAARNGVDVIVDAGGGGDYTTIQEGIDAADPGDTVFVMAGTYNEMIYINYTLTLEGEHYTNTTIDVNGRGSYVVRINADYVNISGFEITDNKDLTTTGISVLTDFNHIHDCEISLHWNGIYTSSADDNHIENNMITDCYNGIISANSFYNTFEHNHIEGHNQGIYLTNSDYHYIFDNYINDTSSDGMEIMNSDHNEIHWNAIFNSSSFGVHAQNSHYNNYTENELGDHNYAFGVTSSTFNEFRGNMIKTGTTSGIMLGTGSDSNLIMENEISDFLGIGAEGIYLSSCKDNIVQYNFIHHNYNGISLSSATNITVIENGIEDNSNNGIDVSSSNDNNIHKSGLNYNKRGINFYTNSDDNNVTENSIEGNSITGVRIASTSDNNKVYNNNFMWNNVHADDSGIGNMWDNGLPDGGNYWDNHTWPDDNFDGFVDIPFTIQGTSVSQDSYPYANPQGWLPGVHNINTGESFWTIQAAIDAPNTSAYHTLELDTRVYYENIILNKTLTIRNRGWGPVWINGTSYGDVIQVVANDCTLEGLEVRGSELWNWTAGIHVMADFTTIRYCIAYENDHGIFLDGANYTNIEQTDAFNNQRIGLYLWESNDNNIWGHYENNQWSGIDLESSDYNFIHDSSASYNSNNGIRLWDSDYNLFENTISEGNGMDGWFLDSSDDNDIVDCEAISNGIHGIEIGWNANYNDIMKCEISWNSNCGIYANWGGYAWITENTIMNNSNEGVWLDSNSDYSTVFLNLFRYNNNWGVQGRDDGTGNNWYGWHNGDWWGNWWTDYRTLYVPGATHDGRVWSWTYWLNGGSTNGDYYPLVDSIVVDDNATGGPWLGTKEYPYQNITSGIDNSTSNDLIRVWEGRYDEDIWLNWTLTIQGNGSEATVINGSGNGNVIEVRANWCNVTNLRVEGSGPVFPAAGIYIINSNDCRIEKVESTWNKDGFLLSNADFNEIVHCWVHNNSDKGINMIYGDGNVIKRSGISDNPNVGILLSNSGSFNGNTIYLNEIINNAHSATGESAGLFFYGGNSKNNFVGFNHIEANKNGIGFRNSGCNNNVVRGNTILNTTGHSVRYTNSPGPNTFFNNNFINASVGHTFSTISTDVWNDTYPAGGNYWDTYSGIDTKSGPLQSLPGSDGIGDSPYAISAGNNDNYPYMNSGGWENVLNLDTDAWTATITQGIKEAFNGNALWVRNGTYDEQLNIGKSISIYGEHKDGVIIDGGGLGSVVDVQANNVKLSSLTIQNSGTSATDRGLQCSNKNSLTLDWVKIHNCKTGLYLYNVDYSKILYSEFENNSKGVWLYNTDGSIVQECFIFNNTGNGIQLTNSGNMNRNWINNCTIESNGKSSSLTAGIYLWGSNTNNNVIENNEIFENRKGFYFTNGPFSNLIRGNNFRNSTNYAIYYSSTTGTNTYYHNNFMNNVGDIWGTLSGDIWDNGYPSGGNYWDSYSGFDNWSGPLQNMPGSDGIGDSPHPTPSSNRDNYPLMEPYIPIFWNVDPEIITENELYAMVGFGYWVDYEVSDPNTNNTHWWELSTNASWLWINNNTGTLQGTPGNFDIGGYWVNVTVYDGWGGMDWTEFWLTVTPFNTPPWINSTDYFNAWEDFYYWNDYNATDNENDTLTWYLDSNATWLSIDHISGLLDGTPAYADVGWYWVNISVTDGKNGWDWRNFTLWVWESNDPPIIITSHKYSATEDVHYWNNYDHSDEEGDPATWYLYTNASFLNIGFTTGNLTGLPKNSDVGTFWVNISCNDGQGGWTYENFTLTVYNTNDPPVITTKNKLFTNEDVFYSIDYNAYDVDPTNDVLDWKLKTNSSFLAINSVNGILSGTPDNDDVGFYWVNVSVTDGNGGLDYTNFTLTVNNTNDPPVIQTTDLSSATEDIQYSRDYDATDEDPTGDNLVWSLHTNASWLGINAQSGILSGTPLNQHVGTYWVNVKVMDGKGGSDFTNFTLTVLNANDAPYITTVPVTSAQEDSLYAQGYNATDPDPSNDVLTWSLSTNASWLTINTGTGYLYGTPDNNDVGPYWVNVSVDDGNGGDDWIKFTLIVYNTNDPPVITTIDDTDADEDSLYSVDYDGTDDDGDSLGWSLHTNASWLTINSGTGVLSGTPLNQHVGTFWVRVSVSDGKGGSDFTNFTLTVFNTNDDPVITTTPVITATEDVYYAYGYNATDEDPSSDTLTWSLTTNASWLTINTGTGYLYGTPDNDDVTYFWVNVSVTDGNGGEDWVYFTITVSNTNDPPVIQTSDVNSATEDTLYSVTYTATDPDPTGDNLGWSLHTNASWLTINSGTGILSGTPLNQHVGTFWVRVSVSDGKGGSDFTNFTLTVFNTNDDPVITTTPVITATEDVYYAYGYNATDEDPSSDTLTWSLTTNASWLTINTGTGYLYGTPDNDDVTYFWVNVSVTDGNGGEDWVYFTITVSNTNDPPVIQTSDVNSATEDTLYSVTYTATDPDPTGDNLGWSLHTNASWLTINSGTGVLSGTPTNAHVGSYWVRVTVSDGKGGSDFTNFTLTVFNTNDDPVITTTPVITATEDVYYAYGYNATDVDPSSDTLTWSLTTNASWLTINTSTGYLYGTPNNDDVTYFWVNVSVTDGNGGEDWVYFTITVSNTNDPPVIQTSDVNSATEDTLYSVTYTATDPDPTGDNLGWSLHTNASWLTINSGTGVLSGTPLNQHVGTFWVRVSVSDGKGGSDFTNFTLTVFNTNDNPVITTGDKTSATQDLAYGNGYNATDMDPTSDTIVWSMKTDASWLSFSAGRYLYGTPGFSDIGNYWVNISIIDGNGGKDWHNFTLTVYASGINSPPSISNGDDIDANEDEFYSVDYNATDLESDPLQWNLTTNATWLTLDSSTGWLNGTPDNDDVGPYYVNVTVWDGKDEAWHNFTLTVFNTNDPPVIQTSDVNSATEDTLYSVTYTATDPDPTGDSLGWSLHTNASWLTINSGTGVLSGTPTNAHVGSYWVRVTVSDGKGGSDFTNFTLTVFNTNDDPVITTTPVTTAIEDVYYAYGYNATDEDPSSDTLTWSLSTNASWLTINTGTGYLYGTPDNDDVTYFWVNVSVTDGNGGEDWVYFTITVSNTNDPPVIQTSDVNSATEDTLYSVTYTATDPDPTGDSLGWSLHTNASWLTINSGTGVLSGTPTNAHVGSYWVRVTVSDGNGGSDFTNFTLTVFNTNDDPVITTAPVTAATEDVYYAYGYNATDEDPSSDTLTWSLSTNASWLTINTGTGYLYGTPDNDDVTYFWVNVSVTDGNGGEDWVYFTITVSNTNDPPVIQTSDVNSATEDTLYSVTYTATDPDPTGDSLGWSLHTNASWLTINSGTGVLSGTPTNAHVGSYWVRVTVSDGNGGSDFTNFTLTVFNTNDDPVITTTPITTAIEDVYYAYGYNATDEDPSSDTLTWSLSTNASWLTINTGTGYLYGTPDNDDVTYFWVNVSVTDGNGGEDWVYFTITVSNTNDPPVIQTSDVNSATEDTLYSVTYTATDPDPTGDSLGWSLHTNASWLTINSGTGVLSGTPTNAHVGSYWVRVTVSDGKGGSDFTNFTLTVFNTNDDPVITTAPVTAATEDVYYAYGYNATDEDPSSDTLTWSLSTNASWLTINTGTGYLYGTPDNDDVTYFWVNVSVTDGNGGEDWKNFTITVSNTNDDPVISTTPTTSATEDISYSQTYSATDIDPTGDSLTWSLETNATWLSINPFSGFLSGTPLNSHVGWYWVNVTVTDGNGGMDFKNFTLTVFNTNDPPTILTTDQTTATEDIHYGKGYNATDVDPSSDTLTWSLHTNATWLSIDPATGYLYGTPDNSHVGWFWVNVSVSDGNGGYDWSNFTITVSNTNDPPVVTTTNIPSATEDVYYAKGYNATDDDGDGLTWFLFTNATWLSINSATGYLYGTPGNSHVGTFWVNISVYDGNGGWGWTNYTLTVTNVNDPPVITTTDKTSILEDSFYSTGYNATDVDPTSDTLTWTLKTNANFLSIIASTGWLTGTPDNNDVGIYWVNVSVTDGNNGYDWTNFTLTVLNVNDEPVITTSNNNTATQDALYSEDYAATDEEMDTLTWSLHTNATWLSIISTTGILSGTPDNYDVGWYWVNVSVSDGKGGSDWTNFTINVFNVNDQPAITTSDVSTATEDVYYAFGYNATDIDPNDTLTWSLSTNASFLNLNTGTGYLYGTPGNSDVGSYWVYISVSDGQGGMDSTNFTLTVFNVNDAPVISTLDDSSANEDQLYYVDYSATDQDPTLDTLTWSLSSNATFLNINTVSGVLSGTPTNWQVGSYWVKVTVSDGKGGKDSTNFTLNVFNINDDPLIVTGDIASANQDVAYYNDYNATDIDPSSDILSWTIKTNASWVDFNTTSGVVNGTPGGSDVGWYWVNVSVSDGNGGSDWTNFTLTVYGVGVNTPPSITTVDQTSTSEDVFYTIDYDATDAQGDPLTWTMKTNAGWLNFNTTNGWLNGTPTNSDVGSYWVNISVSDGTASDWSNFTLVVSNTNDPPSITTSNIISATEDIFYGVGYNATDVDPTSDTLTWAFTSNGTWLSIDPSTGYLYGLPKNSNVGVFWVNITVSDGNGGSDWTNFTITVSNVNDPPVITTSDVSTATEDVHYSVNYDATEVDVGDSLTWNVITNASWLSIDKDTGVLSGTPLNQHVGWFWVNVSVTDKNGGKDWSNFAITVSNVNDPPVINTTDVLNAWEEQLYWVDYNASDDENNTLTWHLNTQASWLSINSMTGIISGTPSNTQVGSYWVNVSVSDGKGGWGWSNFTLDVNNVNDEPVIITTNKVSATEDEAYGQGYNATDEDPTADVLTWNLNTNASWLSIDPSEGYLAGTPSSSDIGWYWVNISVSDGNGGWDWTNFTLTVYSSTENVPPLITTTDKITTLEDVIYAVNYDASDVDGDTLIWSLETNASWLSIDSSSGWLNGTPTNSELGQFWVNISVSDGNGGLDFANFTLSVINVNDAPVINTLDDTTADEDALYSVTYSASDIDPTGDTLTWSWKTNAAWLTFNTGNQLLSGTPDNDDVGSYWVNISVSDGNGGMDFTNFTLNVINQNDEPSITTLNILIATEDDAYGNGYNASDIDVSDTHTWSVHTNASWLSIVSSTGYLAGTPGTSDIGWYWVNVSVTDGNGGTDWTNFTITVYSKFTNRPPQIITSNQVTATEDVLYFVSYKVSDPDTGDTHIWTVNTNASWLTMMPTGALWGIPLNAHVGWYNVNVSVSDGNGGTDWSKFILTVYNVNDKPVISTSDLTTGTEDSLYTKTYAATDDDKGEVLTWHLSTNASWLSLDPNSGLLSGTPLNAHVGWFWVNVSVSDGHGGLDWNIFTITVFNTNDAPMITSGDNTTAIEDIYYNETYTAYDQDPSNDVLTWYLSTNASWLTINTTTGQLNGTANNSFVGWFWVNVTVSDGNGGIDWHNYTITVFNVNDDPVITTENVSLVYEDQLYYVDYEGFDIDPSSDILNWTIVTNATWLVINNATGVLSGIPIWSDVGSYWVNVTVSDGKNGSDWQNFTLTILFVNDPPIITTSFESNSTEDITYRLDINATDEEGDFMVWKLWTNATWLSINSTTGLLYGTPENKDVGWYWVNISVTNGEAGNNTWFNTTLTVFNVNDDPVIITPNEINATEDVSYYLVYQAIDIDPTHDSFTWSLVTNADWLSIDVQTGNLSGTPGNDDVGTYFVEITVQDGNGGSMTTNFTLTVNNVNDPPEITTVNLEFVNEDQFYIINYLGFDLDPVNDTLTWTMSTNALFLTLNSTTGTLEGIPRNGDVGTWWVNITLSDGNGGVDWTNFTLTVYNVNDAPVIQTLELPNATEDMHYYIVLEAFDIDIPADLLLWSMQTNADFLQLDKVSGNLSCSPGNQHVGYWWVNVTVSDPNGGSGWRNFTLYVTNTNDRPTWGDLPKDTSVIAGDNYQFNATVYDIDPGSIFVFSILSDPTSDIKIDASGRITWTPYSVGIYNITLSVSDGVSSISHKYVISVLPRNKQPTIDLLFPENGTISEETNPSFYWDYSDGDGDEVTFTLYMSNDLFKLLSLDSSVAIALGIKSTFFNLEVPLIKGEKYYWTVIPNDGKEYGVCNDGIWSFTIDEDAVLNEAPQFLSNPKTAWTLAVNWTYVPYVFDADNDPVIIEFVNGPEGMTFFDGVLFWLPTAIGEFEVWLRASDGKKRAEQTFTLSITLTEYNKPPHFEFLDEITIKEGDKLDLQVIAIDLDENDDLSFELHTAPTGVEISESGQLTWVTRLGDNGTHHIVIKVFDGHNDPVFHSLAVIIDVNNTIQETEKADDPDEDGLFGILLWWQLMIIIIVLLLFVIIIIVVVRRRKSKLTKILEEIDLIFDEHSLKPKKCKKLLKDKKKEASQILKDGKISQEDMLVIKDHINDYLGMLKGGKPKSKASKPDKDLEVLDAVVVDSEGFSEREQSKTSKIFGAAAPMKSDTDGMTVKLGGWDVDGDGLPDIGDSGPPGIVDPDAMELDSDEPDKLEDEEMKELFSDEFSPYATSIHEGEDRPFLALPPATVFEADFESKNMPQIDEVFVMTIDGMLIQHFSYKGTTLVDEDILASMLTVVQNFIADSFDRSGGLRKLELGNFTILITPGDYLSVVILSADKEVEPLMKPIEMMLLQIEQKNSETLQDWNGDPGSILGLEDAVNNLVTGKL